jgi:subtilisin family serine protease
VPPTTTIAATRESPQISQQFDALGVAQVIVVMKTPPALAGAAAVAAGSTPARLQRHFVTSELSPDSAIRQAVRVGAAMGVAAAASTRRRATQPARPVRIYPNLGVMLGMVTPDGLRGLRTEGDVAAVVGAPHLRLIKPRTIAEAKAPKKIGWGIEALEVPKLWKQGLSGKGVIVAHLDTGADGRHPMLKGAFAVFAEFDFLGDQVTPNPAPHDSGDHGTHTAGTIAGRATNGVKLGVAPGAKLASAMVIEGGNVVARVLAGLDWALGNQVKVLSMSLGLDGWWEDFVPIIRTLRARGVLPVIAVGNEGPGTSRSPGNYPDVLSVGAMGEDGTVADFSSSQRFDRTKDPIVPDLVAPGVDVISAAPNGRYKEASGSSMATPHIAGLAALLFEAKPGATVDEVERAILRSCTRSRAMTVERAGHGLPNGPRALALLTGQQPSGERAVVPSVAVPSRRARRTRRRRAKGPTAGRRPARRTAATRAGRRGSD